MYKKLASSFEPIRSAAPLTSGLNDKKRLASTTNLDLEELNLRYPEDIHRTSPFKTPKTNLTITPTQISPDSISAAPTTPPSGKQYIGTSKEPFYRYFSDPIFTQSQIAHIKERLKLIVFDWDHTVLRIHSNKSGIYEKTDISGYSACDHFSEAGGKFLLQFFREDIPIAIATFASPVVVNEYLRLFFGREDHKTPVFSPKYIVLDKNGLLKDISKSYGLTELDRHKIHFFDDDLDNILPARESGYSATHVKAEGEHYGLTVELIKGWYQGLFASTLLNG